MKIKHAVVLVAILVWNMSVKSERGGGGVTVPN